MRRFAFWFGLLWMALAVEATAASRPLVRVDLYSSYTDNLFQNYSGRADWMNLLYVDLDWLLDSGADLYYTGSASRFAEYGDLFNHTHQLGLSLVRSGAERSAFYAGLNGSARLNRNLYQYRDYLQAEGYAGGKIYLRPELMGRLAYRAQVREYVHMEDFSFLEQIASLQLNRFLPTQTTLLLGAEIGIKSFLREDSVAPAEMGRAGGERHLAQLLVRFKVAQALAAGTGLQLEFRRRENLRDGNRYATLEYDPEEALFDDRYSCEGEEWRGVLKRVWKGGIQGSLTAVSAERSYPARPALDMEGYSLEEQRRDRRNSFTVEGSRRFAVGMDAIREVELHAEWTYVDIDSNDPYYRATAHSYAIGLRWDF